MRILLAEDEKDLNRILVQKLTSEGYSVDACFDGAEALDLLFCADYDSVILDIMMPKTYGLTVLRKLRENRAGSSPYRQGRRGGPGPGT